MSRRGMDAAGRRGKTGVRGSPTSRWMFPTGWIHPAPGAQPTWGGSGLDGFRWECPPYPSLARLSQFRGDDGGGRWSFLSSCRWVWWNSTKTRWRRGSKTTPRSVRGKLHQNTTSILAMWPPSHTGGRRTPPRTFSVVPTLTSTTPELIQFVFSAPGMAHDGRGAFSFIPIFILAAGVVLTALPPARAQVKGNEGDERKSTRWPRREGWSHRECFTGTL